MLSTDPVSLQVAFRFMYIGVSGVFVTLAIFYGLIKGLIKLFPAKKSEAPENPK